MPFDLRFFSTTQTRARFHAVLLLLGVLVLLLCAPRLGLMRQPAAAYDKVLHYRAGQLIAGIVFYLAYACVVARVLLVAAEGSSMTRALLWIPAIMGLTVCVAIGVVMGFAALKEVLDFGGAGHPEWADLDATVEGAFSLAPAAAVIMALTPILIPADLVMQIPRLMIRDVRTGFRSVDDYVQAQETNVAGAEGPAQVLIVEDDIVCATTAVNFCTAVGLTCRHVAGVAEAESVLRRHLPVIKLVLLDNFVRVDDPRTPATGLDWLRSLAREFPRENRSFLVVMISGHAELLLPDAGQFADLVLQKPWSPAELRLLLDERGILPETR